MSETRLDKEREKREIENTKSLKGINEALNLLSEQMDLLIKVLKNNN